MNALIAEAPNVNADVLARHYTLRCPDTIVDFVSARSFLLEAPAHIQRCFGVDTFVALELFHDEESRSDPELFLLIQTSEEAEEAMQKQECLRRMWWQDASCQTQQQMNITLEFV